MKKYKVPEVYEGHTEEQGGVLNRILEETKKQTAYTRVFALSSLGLLAVVFFCFVMIFPGLVSAVSKADSLIGELSETVKTVDGAMGDLAKMSQTITSAGNNMNEFITDNSETMSDAMEKIEEIDFEGLNKAIKDLGDTVEPVAKFFNKFK